MNWMRLLQAAVLTGLLVAVAPGCKQKSPGWPAEPGMAGNASAPGAATEESADQADASKECGGQGSIDDEVDGGQSVATRARDRGGESSKSGAATAPAWACSPEQAAPRRPDWVESMLRERSPQLAEVLNDAEQRRIQILVGEVVETEADETCVRYSGYRLDAEYFYPASAIKTVGAVVALHRLEDTDDWGVDDSVRFEELSLDQVEGSPGMVSQGHETTMRELLEEALVVSSNEAFNGLYDIAGRDALNQYSWDQGLESVRLHHRLGRIRAAPETHAWSPAFDVQAGEGWKQVSTARQSSLELPPHPAPDPTLGEGYVDPISSELVEKPMDFSQKNGISLRDLHAIVAAVARPDITGDFDLGLEEDDRKLLLELMERPPPGIDEAETLVAKARYKPLSPGVVEALDGDRERLRYVNKAGRAYGFHLDSAYVEDTETGRAFFVAVTIWANDNRVLNDNNYEYESLSFPFLVELGRVLATELLVER